MDVSKPRDRFAPDVSGTGEVELPPPREKGPLSLEEVLWLRRSVRQFADLPVSLEAMGQILWSAQGITDLPDHRTAPSAGALYPLLLYVATEDGVSTYIPERHSLAPAKAGDPRRRLYRAALEQEAILEAPLTIAIAASYPKTTHKYGPERGVRYVHIEVGHVAQNIMLQAAAQGLGCVPLGAFNDDLVNDALGLPETETALYLVPVGVPG